MPSAAVCSPKELFDDSQTVDPEMPAIILREMARKYSYVAEIAGAASHDGESVVVKDATISSSSSSRWIYCWTDSKDSGMRSAALDRFARL